MLNHYEYTKDFTAKELSEYVKIYVEKNDEILVRGILSKVLAGPVEVDTETYFWTIPVGGCSGPYSASSWEIDFVKQI